MRAAVAASGQWLAASMLTGIVLLGAVVGRVMIRPERPRGWEVAVGYLLGGLTAILLGVTLFYLVLALLLARDPYEREGTGLALFGALLGLVSTVVSGLLALAIRSTLARRRKASNTVDERAGGANPSNHG